MSRFGSSTQSSLAVLPAHSARHHDDIALSDFFKHGVLWVIGTIVAAAVPFLLLVRGAMYLHLIRGWSTWLAIAGGACLAAFLLILYIVGLRRKLSMRLGQAVVLAVGLYCAYTLAYVSQANVKTPELRQTYTSLHPMLRLSVSTLILASKSLLVTSTGRQPEDYSMMGLRTNIRSLHYTQPDGYVHAVDLRTTGRSEWMNFLTATYFRLMGFRTLRHTGTADHLHVSLPQT